MEVLFEGVTYRTESMSTRQIEDLLRTMLARSDRDYAEIEIGLKVQKDLRLSNARLIAGFKQVQDRMVELLNDVRAKTNECSELKEKVRYWKEEGTR